MTIGDSKRNAVKTIPRIGDRLPSVAGYSPCEMKRRFGIVRFSLTEFIQG